MIVIPSQGGRGGGAKGLIFDVDPKPGKTFAYKKDPEFPSLGAYGESDDITGGMGLQGVAEFDKFVNAGGVLITLGAASYFAPRDVHRQDGGRRAAPRRHSTRPDRLWRRRSCCPNIPIFYGYTERVVPVRWADGPLLRVPTDEQRAQRADALPGQRPQRFERPDAGRGRDSRCVRRFWMSRWGREEC